MPVAGHVTNYYNKWLAIWSGHEGERIKKGILSQLDLSKLSAVSTDDRELNIEY